MAEGTQKESVAAKQILIHDERLYMIDAAGQLWTTRTWQSDVVYWQQIELPKS